MAKLVRFSYINLYQQISNIMLYKKLKPTKTLKLVFICSLLFLFIRTHKLSFKFRFLVRRLQRSRKQRKSNMLFKLYYARLAKKMSTSSDKMSSMLSFDSQLLSPNVLFVTPEQSKNIKLFISNKKLLANLFRRYRQLSIETLSYNIVYSFLYKKTKKIVNTVSVLLSIYSNYGITPKFIYSHCQSNKLTVDQMMRFLIRKLDLFMFTYFPLSHIEFSKQAFSISVSGIRVQDYNKYILKVGDLLSISGEKKQLYSHSRQVHKFFNIIRMIFSLNKTFFLLFFSGLKSTLFSSWSLCVVTPLYWYTTCVHNSDWVMKRNDTFFFLKTHILAQRLIGYAFNYEHSIFLNSKKSTFLWYSLDSTILFSVFVKRIVRRLLVFGCYHTIFTWRISTDSCHFASRRNIKRSTIEAVMLYVFKLFIKICSSYFILLRNLQNYTTAVINILLNTFSVYAILYVSVFIPCTRFEKYSYKRLKNIALRLETQHYFKYNLFCRKTLQLKYFIYNNHLFVTARTFYHTSTPLDCMSYITHFYKLNELRWVLLQNTTFNTTGPINVLQWSSVPNIVNVLIYSFDYLFSKPVATGNFTFSKKSLPTFFRYANMK